MLKEIPNYEGKRILIVEDNELNMEIFQEFLEMTNVSIENAYDGVEAVEKVAESEENYYDLILSDIRMIYMNGYTMTKSIRNMNRVDVKQMPIIGMTADAEWLTRKDAIEAGMNDQIYKPFAVEDLLDMLNHYL